MSLIAKESGGAVSEPVPQGTHSAVCVGIYDIGTQHSAKYTSWSESVVITWQLPSLRIEIDGDDLPRVISNTYTLSLGEKANLRKMLEGWRGRAFTPVELDGFSVSKLLGVPCMMQIIHKSGKGANASKVYANIGSIMPIMKGSPTVIPEGDTVLFDIDTNGPGGVIPETFPKWIQEKIKESKEYVEAVETHVEQPTAGVADTPSEENADVDDSNCPF